MPRTKATLAIPYIYRFLLTNVEPIYALSGVFMILTDPGAYVSFLTRATSTTIQPSTDFIYMQLAGGWLYIAFTEMVVLRFIDDLRTWRLLCFGILLSDLLYTHSIAQALGGWQEWVKISEWTGQDWIVTITTWPFVLVRMAIVFGIGLQNGDKKRE